MDLSNLVGNTGVASLLYYSLMIITAVFVAGWVLNSKLQNICKENNKELEDTMVALVKRVDILDKEALRISAYQEDMNNVVSLIKDVRQDMRENFNSLSGRIDTLLLSQKSV